jgi:hypothetical protein
MVVAKLLGADDRCRAAADRSMKICEGFHMRFSFFVLKHNSLITNPQRLTCMYVQDTRKRQFSMEDKQMTMFLMWIWFASMCIFNYKLVVATSSSLLSKNVKISSIR